MGQGKVLFLAPVPPASGNATTTARLAGFLEAVFDGVVIVDVGGEEEEVRERLETFSSAGDIAVVVLLHAWRAGQYLRWVSGQPKVVVIFGGTDVNEMLQDPGREQVMRTVVAQADKLVCFNNSLKRLAMAAWLPPTTTDEKYAVVPQSITCRLPLPLEGGTCAVPQSLHEEGDRHMRCFLDRCGVPASRTELCIFLAPMGIRSVKDPLCVVSEFALVHRAHPNAWLVYVGPVYEKALHDALLTHQDDGVRYHAAVSQEELHRLYCSQFTTCVVNCSRSEGQPQAAMEGMLCGVPALLRDIPGNAAVAQNQMHPVAAFFDPAKPGSFQTAATRLVNDRFYAKSLGEAGQEAVRAHYAVGCEKDAYTLILNELVP